ncbi:MAG TPA: hypothetical protein PKH55_09310 [Bacteroidales bacterium]|nr:hypothetical protein [Bacteroidales bacterium]
MGGRERMNVLQPNKKTSIITLLTNGVSQREIGRKVRVDRKTIRKYAGWRIRIKKHKQQAPTDRNPPPRPPAFEAPSTRDEPMPAHARSACEEHRPWIEEQVRLGRKLGVRS